MAGTTPQIKQNTCTDPNKPLYPPIEVGSDFWFSWLREQDVKSFHFESDRGKFTARKEGRSTTGNEYWYAYRKVAGKLRKVYLGAMDEISSNRLEEVATEISQPAQDYYYSRPAYIAKKQQKLVAQTSDTDSAPVPKSYPTEDKESCVTDSSELEALRLEVENLRSQLAAADQKIAIQGVLQERTDNALAELIDRIRSRDKGYKDNGFSQGIKYITQLAESKGL